MDFVRASWGTAMLCPYRDEAQLNQVLVFWSAGKHLLA
jgi:hypothetical protein